MSDNKSPSSKPELSVENHTEVRITHELDAAVDRCYREIAEILNRPDVVAGLAPAWLVTLGVSDWEAEKRLIQKGKL
jgi:hypothetical protein